MSLQQCQYEDKRNRWRCTARATRLQSYIRPLTTSKPGSPGADAYCKKHLSVVESDIKAIRKDGFAYLLGSDITVTNL
jgi:hypothetical protein